MSGFNFDESKHRVDFAKVRLKLNQVLFDLEVKVSAHVIMRCEMYNNALRVPPLHLLRSYKDTEIFMGSNPGRADTVRHQTASYSRILVLSSLGWKQTISPGCVLWCRWFLSKSNSCCPLTVSLGAFHFPSAPLSFTGKLILTVILLVITEEGKWLPSSPSSSWQGY